MKREHHDLLRLQAVAKVVILPKVTLAGVVLCLSIVLEHQKLYTGGTIDVHRGPHMTTQMVLGTMLTKLQFIATLVVPGDHLWALGGGGPVVA